jgi:hypothetical protein
MWCRAVAAGIPDEVFWDCTLAEVVMLYEHIVDQGVETERRAILRAGLIASAIYNARAGKVVCRPEDFLARPTREVTPEQMADILRGWAGGRLRKAN